MTSCLANIHTFTRIGQFIGNSVTVPLAIVANSSE
jgi:hypothetical protein